MCLKNHGLSRVQGRYAFYSSVATYFWAKGSRPTRMTAERREGEPNLITICGFAEKRGQKRESGGGGKFGVGRTKHERYVRVRRHAAVAERKAKRKRLNGSEGGREGGNTSFYDTEEVALLLVVVVVVAVLYFAALHVMYAHTIPLSPFRRAT